MENTNETQAGQFEDDPWAMAFAALDKKGEENPETDAAGSAGDSDADAAESGGNEEVPAGSDAGDGDGSQGESGDLGADLGSSGTQNYKTPADLFGGVASEDIDKARERFQKGTRDQAINDIAAEFIKRGVRNSDGRLGADINDEDICKRDEDGVPHFYNPETGREFTGDNPRRQAQEWVEDYNKELADVFNRACEKYERHLVEQMSPALKVLEFAPKYAELDDIRKGMFENVVQDYEIRDDSGNLVGYSCDLDKALATVERQIEAIKKYAGEHAKNAPSGPVLDMKNSSGAVNAQYNEPPKSLAEAMERQQDALLEKMRSKKNG